MADAVVTRSSSSGAQNGSSRHIRIIDEIPEKFIGGKQLFVAVRPDGGPNASRLRHTMFMTKQCRAKADLGTPNRASKRFSPVDEEHTSLHRRYMGTSITLVTGVMSRP